MPSRRQSRAPANAEKPIEWVVGGLAAVFVLALLVYLVGQAVSSADRAPRFSTVIEEVEQVGNLFHVRLAVINDGDRTAAQLTLRGELSRPGAAREVSELRFDYVPQHSLRRGTLLFSGDPRVDATLKIAVTSFVDP